MNGDTAAMPLAVADPKGLVRESYRIEGIIASQCRSIFLDWALSLAPGLDPRDAGARLIAEYAEANPGHPMTEVLRAALATPQKPRRLGGRLGRVQG